MDYAKRHGLGRKKDDQFLPQKRQLRAVVNARAIAPSMCASGQFWPVPSLSTIPRLPPSLNLPFCPHCGFLHKLTHRSGTSETHSTQSRNRANTSLVQLQIMIPFWHRPQHELLHWPGRVFNFATDCLVPVSSTQNPICGSNPSFSLVPGLLFRKKRQFSQFPFSPSSVSCPPDPVTPSPKVQKACSDRWSRSRVVGMPLQVQGLQG